MGIKIGPYTLDPGVILAPMSGVTDWPFRRLVKRLGAPLVVSEMVASNEVLRAEKHQRRLEGNLAEEAPMAVQLVGYDPQAMADAARIAVDRGAGIVDINFGCPAKKVVGKLCGSALMREEGLATRIMGAVVEAVPVPVTMKMRLGWDEGEKNAPNLAKAAESVGIQMLTVHGRTRAQRYRGSADWNAIRPTVESTSLPVIANGDIEGPESIDQALKQSGAAGVMLGRAVQGRPWRISQAMAWISRGEWPEEPDATARGEMALEHFEGLLQLHGPVTGVLKSRTHLSNWVKGLEGATRFREEVFRLDSPDQVRRRIEVFFANTTVANSTDLAA